MAFRIRVAVLLAVLVVVLAYAWREIRARSTDWRRTQRVAVVLLADPEHPPSAESILAFETRLAKLADTLTEQRRIYTGGAPPPFEFSSWGPLPSSMAPPALPADDPWSLFFYQRALSNYVAPFDEALHLESRLYDVRIYVRVREPDQASRQSAEGASLVRGRIGVVAVELLPSSVDFGLFVVAHELMHTRGASDKYGPDGLALVPDGLAEPNLVPLYPQKYIELMARGLPLAPGHEVAPEALSELSIGPLTAREIGWLEEP